MENVGIKGMHSLNRGLLDGWMDIAYHFLWYDVYKRLKRG